MEMTDQQFALLIADTQLRRCAGALVPIGPQSPLLGYVLYINAEDGSDSLPTAAAELIERLRAEAAMVFRNLAGLPLDEKCDGIALSIGTYLGDQVEYRLYRCRVWREDFEHARRTGDFRFWRRSRIIEASDLPFLQNSLVIRTAPPTARPQ